MIITYQQVSKITFPVFTLPNGNWQTTDGLLFLEEGIVDDRNMPGLTLGSRRVQTPHKNLVPLRKCITEHQGLIKQKSKYYIDSTGAPFIYEKTKMCALKYYLIRKVEQKEVASLIWLKDLKHPFPIPRPPKAEMTWAGVLHLHGLPWMLYEYSQERRKDTSRKV